MPDPARSRLRPFTLAAVAAAALLLLACSGDTENSSADQSRWRPGPTTEPWQFQLQGRIDTAIPAPVYEVDGFDVPGRTVEELQAMGRKVICYIDVGSWERYRPDAGRFPRSVIGKTYEGYPNERWLDIRRFRKFAGPLKSRIRMCARKGFDGLEPDNIAGYENRTGFPIRAKHQLRFNRWIARQAHRRGLAVGLKNDGRQAGKLVDSFDFAVVEQCFQYDECGQYRPFIRAGKAVFEVEYEIANRRFCRASQRARFSAIGKEYDLYARPWRPCRDDSG
ncbi:MAG: endo alpha-1,4 polygalactosaminidase [Solirubrobacterales bacterium]|nr:endo alpha-1,4 polygalactosaminidase [Solirubrobacterales bacterium]